MRRSPSWSAVALLWLACLLGSAVAVSATGFSGYFRGALQGQPAEVQLQQSGDQASGLCVVAGYRYQLQLQIQGSQAEGMLLDPNTGGGAPLRAWLEGELLRLDIPTMGSGGQALQLALQRGEPEAAGAPGAASGAEASARAMPGGALDPVLMGTWSQSTSYVSGDFSGVSQTVLTLAPDGRVIDGGSRTVAGGNAGSVDSGAGGGGGLIGYWSTQGQVLYLNEGAGWQPVARYYVEGNSCMLTRADGRREVWARY
jgi:hypothetical protein